MNWKPKSNMYVEEQKDMITKRGDVEEMKERNQKKKKRKKKN